MATQTQTREVSGFDRIELSYVGDLFITQGDAEALSIEAEEDLLGKLESRVEKGALMLGRTGDWKDRLLGGLFALTRPRPVYRVTLRNLRGLKISGQGKVEMAELKTDRLELNVSGFADIRLGQLSADSLSVTSSGRSELELSGRVGEQSLFVSGSADYRAFDLQSEKASVRISGHGTVKLAVASELDVAISGYGAVAYRGQPHLRQAISGGGQVRQEAG